MHHARSSVMRLFIPRKCGGQCLLHALIMRKTLHNREGIFPKSERRYASRTSSGGQRIGSIILGIREHTYYFCGRLANSEYLQGHNQLAKIIHQQLALHYRYVESEVPYYKYVPDPVLGNGNITLYWDWCIITDRTSVACKPDIAGGGGDRPTSTVYNCTCGMKLALGGWIKGIETKIQKAVLLETARIVRRFLNLEA
uniref:SFRICE_014939 n=1 Tax=Spodoptera frugiperda TaxID=7108 RepID=A0A2H1WXT8_SPOFR